MGEYVQVECPDHHHHRRRRHHHHQFVGSKTRHSNICNKKIEQDSKDTGATNVQVKLFCNTLQQEVKVI